MNIVTEVIDILRPGIKFTPDVDKKPLLIVVNSKYVDKWSITV